MVRRKQLIKLELLGRKQTDYFLFGAISVTSLILKQNIPISFYQLSSYTLSGLTLSKSMNLADGSVSYRISVNCKQLMFEFVNI